MHKHVTLCHPGIFSKTDQNLVFALERTFYSALNLDLFVVMFGLGLLMVCPRSDPNATGTPQQEHSDTPYYAGYVLL